jgi:hypothetical protein
MTFAQAYMKLQVAFCSFGYERLGSIVYDVCIGLGEFATHVLQLWVLGIEFSNT